MVPIILDAFLIIAAMIIITTGSTQSEFTCSKLTIETL